MVTAAASGYSLVNRFAGLSAKDANEDDKAVAIDAGLQAYFVYYRRMEDDNIPMDVTDVRIYSSVRAIKNWAFCKQWELRIVILNEELEEIGRSAFADCISIGVIIIPNNVRAI